MLEARMSQDLERLIDELDENWEAEQINRLPFPIAYAMARLRSEDYAWDLLLKDLLHAILTYLANIGISDYLYSAPAADFDVNDELKKLARPMHEGHWLAIVRRCAGWSGDRVVAELPDAFAALEAGQLQVELTFSRFGLRTDRQGVLSSLVTARNRLFAHGATLTPEEKRQATPILVGLLRVCLRTLSPIWAYELVSVVGEGKAAKSLVLHGVDAFKQAESPLEKGVSSALVGESGSYLPVFPLAYSAVVGQGKRPTMLDESAEVYLLNQVARKRVPVYLGADGSQQQRPDLSERFDELVNGKRVWEYRQDIELDEVVQYARRKLSERLDAAVWNNLFDPERFVRRADIAEVLDQLIDDPNRRALFVAGGSGSGKTAALLDLLHRRHGAGDAGLLLRAVELPGEIVKPKRLGRRICEELGTTSSFAEVLERVGLNGGLFVLVIDGLNEFTAADRDSSLLFRAVNQLLADHADERALKVLVSTRSDEGFASLMPGGHLPMDAEDQLWLPADGRPYLEVGALSDEQASEVLRRLGVEDEQARAMTASGGQAARNPNLLRKAAAGALSAADLPRLDERGITARFLDQRIGRDRELRRTIEQVVALMGKARNLTLSESELGSRSPKLLERLMADGARPLTMLRDLGLVQVIEHRADDDAPTWSLALAHDTLFEALVMRQRRETLVRRLAFTTAAVGVVVLVAHLAMSFMTSSFERILAERIEQMAVEVSNLDLDVSTAERVDAAYRAMFGCARSMGTSVVEVLTATVWRVVVALLGPVALMVLFHDQWSHRRMVNDVRGIRVLFFGQAEMLRQDRWFILIVSPAVILMIVWTLYRLGGVMGENSHETMIAVIGPLLWTLAGLIIVVWPTVHWYRIRVALRGSPLLREYTFSQAALKGLVGVMASLAVMVTVGFMFFGVFVNLDGALFIDDERLRRAREEAVLCAVGIDFELIAQHPVSDRFDANKVQAMLNGGLLDEFKNLLSGRLLEGEDAQLVNRLLVTGWLLMAVLFVGTPLSLWLVSRRVREQGLL